MRWYSPRLDAQQLRADPMAGGPAARLLRVRAEGTIVARGDESPTIHLLFDDRWQ